MTAPRLSDVEIGIEVAEHRVDGAVRIELFVDFLVELDINGQLTYPLSIAVLHVQLKSLGDFLESGITVWQGWVDRYTFNLELDQTHRVVYDEVVVEPRSYRMDLFDFTH